jgi:asparaginyl-tRNA synthetase
MREWLRQRNFTEIFAPIITRSLLYRASDSQPFEIDYFNRPAYLTQCSAFYLESVLPAFERAYVISPTFRREPSHSAHQLVEYWHVKGEISFADLQDVISLAEDMLQWSVQRAFTNWRKGWRAPKSGLQTNDGLFQGAFKRVDLRDVPGTHRNAEGRVAKKSLQRYVDQLEQPTWFLYPEDKAEPFPYVRTEDGRVMAADLLFPKGLGEIVGCAEKESARTRLQARLPVPSANYEWYAQLRDLGCPPHAGFGLGFERLIRAALGLAHVRDAIPFPRTSRRLPTP